MKLGEKILVTSLKGGVGKSTVAGLLAAALAKDGASVLLFDLDFRSRSLELMTDVCDIIVFTLYDYMKNQVSAEDVALKIGSRGSEFMFCPAPDESLFESERDGLYMQIPEYLEKLACETGADYVVCDSGAESFIPGIVAKNFADCALIVSEQSRTSIRSAEITANNLAASDGIKNIRLVINNFDIDAANHKKRAGLIEMIDDSAVRCIGVVPHDESLPELQDRGVIPFGQNPSAKAMENIARRITGEHVPLFCGMKKLRKKITL